MQHDSDKLSLDLCLDFCNTVDWHGSERPIEKLQSYTDLIRWSSDAGVLDQRTSRILLRKSLARPSKAQDTLTKARELREVIYRIFSSISHFRSPSAKDLKFLNRNITNALTELQIIRDRQVNRFSWQWKSQRNDLDQMLLPITRSAAVLLVSDQLRLVKECANEEEGCGWLFVDTSKNHSRRWCSMSSCGNRSKVRNYYARSARTK